MENKLTISKIPIETLLNILTDLYEKGVDYVDLIAHQDEESKEDRIGIAVYKDYMAEDAPDRDALEFENGIVELKDKDDDISENNTLSEDDLNQLI